MNTLTMQRRIAAPPEAVFAFLVEPEKMLRWFGVSADIDPRPGGLLHIAVTGGDVVKGEYIEVIPPSRVTFTWGWVGDPDLAPGSTTVTFELAPDGDGTALTLTHADLPVAAAESHARGWTYFLGRLETVGEGREPGPVSLEELAATEPRLTMEEPA
jgi:uncharacterized protein YndB with AHSA1/START domain